MNRLISQGAGHQLPGVLSALIRAALVDMGSLDRSVYDAYSLEFHKGSAGGGKALVDLSGGVVAARGLASPSWTGQRWDFAGSPGNLTRKLKALNEVEFGALDYAFAELAMDGDDLDGERLSRTLETVRSLFTDTQREIFEIWGVRLNFAGRYVDWEGYDKFARVALCAADELDRVGF